MEILKRPLLTEKVAAMNEKGVYGFVVDVKANKIQIKKAVEQMYGVNVDNVRTMIVAGKRKVRFTKSGVAQGRKPKYKKAIVQLAEGEIIDFYSEA
jgi:large subunit ribosomal protein L23